MLELHTCLSSHITINNNGSRQPTCVKFFFNAALNKVMEMLKGTKTFFAKWDA